MPNINTMNDFWGHFDKGDSNECWNWKGDRTSAGYGRIAINGIKYYAHRLSYQLHCDEIKPGMFILHTCDNPTCVNPNHLRQGTQKDNMIDKAKRNRCNAQKGERCWIAKLTWEKVREIRRRYIYKVITTVDLGKEFNVDPETVRHVVVGDTWKE